MTMMINEANQSLLPSIADWVDQGRGALVDLGLDVSQAAARAAKLLDDLRRHRGLPMSLNEIEPDVLYAALEILREACATHPEEAFECASRVWESLKRDTWTSDDFSEREDLACSYSFVCWRAARLLNRPLEKYNWENEYRNSLRGSLQWEIGWSSLLRGRSQDQGELNPQLSAEDAFQAVMFLQDNCDAVPEKVGSSSIDLYRVVTSSRSTYPADIGSFLAGSAARIAGTAMRQSGVPDDASEWLSIAESEFRDGPCASADLAKVAYQRLALLYRLSRFDLIEGEIPAVDETFVELGMHEDHVKCRVLWAASLKIAGRYESALDILEPLREDRERIPPALYGWLLLELGDLHQIGGDHERGIAELAEAAQLLGRNNHLTGLADVTSMLGSAYRSRGMLHEAVGLFEKGREAYAQLGMKSLEAYIRVLLAETFLAMGKLAEAEREIIAAFPTFREQRMVAEAAAGLGLLREVTRRRRSTSISTREERDGPRKR